MILPPRVPVVWQMYAGSPSEMTITLMQGGQPIALPSLGWRSQWRKTRESIRFVEIEVDTSQAEEGKLKLLLDKDQTRLVVGQGVYDLELSTISRTYLYGSTSCISDVTRD